MGKQELDNLVKIGTLKIEPPSRKEFDGMLESAKKRLADAQNKDLDPDSQFDLAYGAAHRLALAALRHQGYRSENRVTVFQTLAHTLNTRNSACDCSIPAASNAATNSSTVRLLSSSSLIIGP